MANPEHAILVMLIMGLVTLATRIVPVMIFGRGKKVPDSILPSQ